MLDNQTYISNRTYNKGIVGCSKNKCPCRVWISCSRYVDITVQQQKLKYKSEHPDQFSIDIQEYYKNCFKIRYEYPDGFGNG